MAKRITAVLMLIVLCVGLCACSTAGLTSGGGDDKYPGNPDEIDYPKVSDPKNSVLALTDTLTGNKVYIGQSKAEIEQFYGKGEPQGKYIRYFDRKFYVFTDNNDYVVEIGVYNNIINPIMDPDYYNSFPEDKPLHAEKNERFKTDKGLTLNNSFDDFQKVYERKYRLSRDSYMVVYNNTRYFLSWTKRDDNSIDRISIYPFYVPDESIKPCDYGDPEKVKNSDLAITDTKTGKQIYFGQSKKDVEEILGESCDTYKWNTFIYEDGLALRYDDKWCVSYIGMSTDIDEPESRYKTHKGFDLYKSPEDFKDLYNTDGEQIEIEQNGMKFFIKINVLEGKVGGLAISDQ